MNRAVTSLCQIMLNVQMAILARRWQRLAPTLAQTQDALAVRFLLMGVLSANDERYVGDPDAA